MPAQERAHTREATTELFATEAKRIAPHKRIRWTEADGWQGIDELDRQQFAEAAPAVDIERALSAADLWLRANPAKKKQNPYRFFVNWIARQQEKGGDQRGTRPAPVTVIPSMPLKSFAQQAREDKEAARHGPWVVTPKVLTLDD